MDPPQNLQALLEAGVSAVFQRKRLQQPQIEVENLNKDPLDRGRQFEAGLYLNPSHHMDSHLSVLMTH